MKKLLICAVGLIFCLFLASCAANKEESSKAKSPTGYPANQVQNDCIMYNGVLYFQGTGSEKSPRMQEVGSVKSVDNYKLPTEDFAASHLKIGDKVLILEEEGKLRLFVQRTDVNRLEEFFCVEEDNTKAP